MAETKSSTEPIYFWREHEPFDGYLSQWYNCEFKHEGNTFNCTEQWMMWNKAKVFNDDETAKKILKTTSPRQQKSLGRQVKNFDNDVWDKQKYDVVKKGNHLKFTQATTTFPDRNGNGVPLKTILLKTHERELIEASPFDRIWGIGFSAKDAISTPRDKWGENLLGKALMEVRSELRVENDSEQQSVKE